MAPDATKMTSVATIIASAFFCIVEAVVSNAIDTTPWLPMTGMLHSIAIVVALVMSVMAAVSLFLLANTTDIELSKRKPVQHIEATMGLKQILGRACLYCGRHFWGMLLLFTGMAVLAKTIAVLALSPWGAWVQNEEAAIVSWLRENNFVAMMDIDQSIKDRAQVLYYSNIFYNIIMDACYYWLYYVALACCVRVVVKSYRGADTTVMAALRGLKRQLVPLLVISLLFSTLMQAGLAFLLVPGIIVYTYCIMALPQATVTGKYKLLENFGKGKDLIKGNVIRVLLLSLVILGLRLLVQFPMAAVNTAVQETIGGTRAIVALMQAPYAHLGELLALESLNGVFMTLFGPLEAALVAMLFIDLEARVKAKQVEQKQGTQKDKRAAMKDMPFDARVKRARFCPNCGISVRQGVTRCPNCRHQL